MSDDPLVGQRVVEIRPMTYVELEANGWSTLDASAALVFEGGAVVYASRDPEGNDPGVLFGHDEAGSFRIEMLPDNPH